MIPAFPKNFCPAVLDIAATVDTAPEDLPTLISYVLKDVVAAVPIHVTVAHPVPEVPADTLAAMWTQLRASVTPC